MVSLADEFLVSVFSAFGVLIFRIYSILNNDVLFLFSERFKQDYEKLEALLQTLPNKTTHEVMVRLKVCVYGSKNHKHFI